MSANFFDYIAVQNTLSLYCVALDTKDFLLLGEIFMPEVEARYPFEGGNVNGVRAIAAAISQRCLGAMKQSTDDS